MGQQRDQGRNQKIPWNKWKWEHNNPKSVGHWESNPKREIHNITGIYEEKKSSNNNPILTLKGTWKRTTNQALTEHKGGNNKEQSRNKQNRV